MIFVLDMERMAAFYRDGFGLRVVEETRQDGWLGLDAGGVLLGLHAIPADIASTIEIATPPEAREETPIKLLFETTDIAAARVGRLRRPRPGRQRVPDREHTRVNGARARDDRTA